MITTDRAALIAALKELVVEECGCAVEPSAIGDSERLIGGGLDLDSLDALQISMAVKERYGVRIEGGPKTRAALASIGTLADFILAGHGD